MLQTNIPDQVRQSQSEEAVSVIHAPESFQSWVGLGVTTLSPEADKQWQASSDTTVPVTDEPLDRTSPHSSPKPENIIVPPPSEQSLKVIALPSEPNDRLG